MSTKRRRERLAARASQMTCLTATRRRANTALREYAARRQSPLPIEEQQKRAAARAEAQAERYPRPPVYDQLAAVRGDPTIRGNPQPIFRPRYRSGLGVFDAFRTVRSIILARGMGKITTNQEPI